jgi:DNA processing protein
MQPAEERRAYFALALIPGIGPTRLERLLQRFGSYRQALAAPFGLLAGVPGLSRAAATAIAGHDPEAVDRVEQTLARLGGRVLTPLDLEFPAGFRVIDDPPALIFLEGRVELLDRLTVALVGSRHPTPYGVDVTRMIAGLAARAGLTVVSGMARGLDAVAHWAAVAEPGGTIGVLGNGLGVIYPAANRTLYRRVAAEGLLVTEHPPGERPNAGSFPRRNRLISALARATIVVEGGETSGTRITAAAAVGQGREVLVVPGPIDSRMSRTPHDLLRVGAKPFLDPSDLWELYPELKAGVPPVDRTVLVHRPRVLLEALDRVPRSMDALATELGWSPADLAAALTELEVVGLVERSEAGFARMP